MKDNEDALPMTACQDKRKNSFRSFFGLGDLFKERDPIHIHRGLICLQLYIRKQCAQNYRRNM